MDWSRQKVNSNSLNNGQEYTTDSQVSIEALNAMVNSGLYSQDVVDGLKAQPYSAVANYKYPNIVTYNGSSYMAIYQEDGEYTEFNGVVPTVSSYWALLAQKGADGVKGDSGINSALLSNTAGTSDTNGYTQQAVNGIISNPNLLINPTFEINQRGADSYNTNNTFTVDRWKMPKNGDASYNVSTKTLSAGSTGTYVQFYQRTEINISQIRNKYMTLSLNSQVISGTLFMNIGYYRNNSFTALINKTFSASEANFITHSVSVIIPANLLDTDILAVRFYVQSGGKIKLDWAKLEMGQVATTFTPPIIAEELPKCQRFYQLRTASYTFPTSALDRTPVMYKDGTIGTTTINGITYKYCDAEI